MLCSPPSLSTLGSCYPAAERSLAWRPSTTRSWRDASPPTLSFSASPLSRAFLSNNWRNKAPSLSTKPGEVHYLIDANSCHGSIIERQLKRANNEQAYSHPVVVLMSKIVDGQEIVLFRIATSVRRQGISAKNPKYQKDHLLVEDHCTQPHLGTQPLKLVPGSDTFEVATYINCQQGQMYEIEAKYLRRFKAGTKHITLDEAAVCRLLSAGCNWEVRSFTPREISAAAQPTSQCCTI